MKHRAVLTITTVGLVILLLTPICISALRTGDIILVDASGRWYGNWWGNSTSRYYNIYDDDAEVWGNYITWRRAIDLDEDGNIDWFEPSWIVAHDINTDITWNVTETVHEGERIVDTAFYHCNSPSIWNKYIVYNEQYLTSSVQSKLVMYYIPTSEYTNLSFQKAGASYSKGAEVKLYGDWIIFGQYISALRIACFIYNWDEDYGRALEPITTDYHTFGYLLDDNYAIYTRYDTATPDDWEIVIHNLTSAKNIIISAADVGADKSRCTSIYEDNLGIARLDTVPSSNWNVYILDFSIIDWNLYPNIYNYLDWLDFGDNYTTVTNATTYDDINIIVWNNWACYQSGRPGFDDWNIIVYNINSDRTTNITENPYSQKLLDFKGDKVIFRDNINSDTHHDDVRDDFDIYRTLTEIEGMGSTIWAIAPFIIIIMVIGVMLGAFKLFGDSAGG